MLPEVVGTKHDVRSKGSGWIFIVDSQGASLTWQGAPSEPPCQATLCRELENAFGRVEGPASIRVIIPFPAAPDIADSGCAARCLDEGSANSTLVHRDMFYQSGGGWLGAAAKSPLPLRYVLTQESRHPLRPSKPTGEVYRRYIAWLEMDISFRTVNINDDLLTFSRWMNDPVVAQFWEEEGDLTKHRSYLQRIADDKHTLGLIGCFDDEPFGYFEVYWAKEDRIAPFYDAADYDRGWHVLVGEDKYRGKPYLTAWMPSISHYIFLDDCRTQRIVIEPRVDNRKIIKSLARCGYALLKEFDFPHKRAMLGMLSRERFFSDALWLPQD